MIIKKISIKNFRGIKELSNFELNNYNVLVGKNDSGKSIILYAIDAFLEDKAIDSKDVFKGIGDEKVIIELSFIPGENVNSLLLDSDGYLTIRNTYGPDGKIQSKDYYCFDYIDQKFQDLWNKKDNEINEIISSYGAKIAGKKTSEKIEQVMDLIRIPRNNIYHNIGDVKKKISDYYGCEMPFLSFFKSEQNIDSNSNDFQNQFKYIALSYFDKKRETLETLRKEIQEEYCSEFELISMYMKKNVPSLSRILTRYSQDWKKSISGFDLSLEFENENYEIPISHKGTGFKRLLMVAYFEYLANKDHNDKNIIYAIEEPETYLHPLAQEVLLNSLVKISNESQIVITTHSPVFAGADESEQIILVTKDSLSASQYSRNIDTDLIISELGIKPNFNLLKHADFLLFVEGKNDVEFLSKFAKTVLDKDLLSDKIICIPGGGDNLSNLADLDLFVILKGNKNYAVMIDGDDGKFGKDKVHLKLEKKCKDDGAMFLKLPKRDIENYCHHDVLTQVYRFVEPFHNISDTEDVGKEIQKIYPRGSIKDGKNIEIFKAMTKDQWIEMDKDKKVHDFIIDIYRRIGKIENLASL